MLASGCTSRRSVLRIRSFDVADGWQTILFWHFYRRNVARSLDSWEEWNSAALSFKTRTYERLVGLIAERNKKKRPVSTRRRQRLATSCCSPTAYGAAAAAAAVVTRRVVRRKSIGNVFFAVDGKIPKIGSNAAGCRDEPPINFRSVTRHCARSVLPVFSPSFVRFYRFRCRFVAWI